MTVKRQERTGTHRAAFEKNKRRILATQSVCGICGRPVDMTLKAPHPMSPCIDHIIPINKGGHPSDIENLQLAHWSCNRNKSDKLFKNVADTRDMHIGNRSLHQSMDWSTYKAKEK